MESDNQETIYCADDDDEYRMYCNVCDKLDIDRCYKNHLKSGTHINCNYKRQRLNNTIQQNFYFKDFPYSKCIH